MSRPPYVPLALDQAESRGMTRRWFGRRALAWPPRRGGQLLRLGLKEASTFRPVVIGFEMASGKDPALCLGSTCGAPIHAAGSRGLLIKGGGHKWPQA